MTRPLKPETKTLRYMKNRGLVAAIASRRIRKISFDLWGFVDVIGFRPRLTIDDDDRLVVPMVCVQATSSSNQAARMKKILASPALRARAFALIASGHHVEVWGWISGRHADAQALRRFTLQGRSPAGLVWHDRGMTEVDPELLTMPPE